MTDTTVPVSPPDGASIPDAGHTPGPWFVEEGHIQRDSGGIRYWQVQNEQDAICCNQFCYSGNGEANARLIAAAPELLAALQRIMNSGHAISQPLRWEAESAIAKARGKA